MSLRAEFQDIPVEVFDDMDDLVLDGLLRQHNIVYAAGGNATDTPTDYPVRIIEDTLTGSELVTGIALTGDRKFLTPALELAVTPVPKDSIVLLGRQWNIYLVETDPAEALWVLYARE